MIGRTFILAAALGTAFAGWAADRHPAQHYDRYFNHYTDSFVTKIFLKSKTRKEPTTTMDQVRRLIRNFHEMSGGMHQIIYLVGWQYDGHDSKYPSWDKVGDQCRSSLSDDPLTSLRMVMREAREKYNCDLSLHLNMNDAHPDSPDWKLYNEKDLLCKDKNGKPRALSTWFRISHVKEWKSGYAKKRIDALLEMIPELKDAKTVHIDAFFAQSSDFDGISIEDDKVAVKEITDYWHSLGIDVTNEFITSLDMIGYFPMVYHYNLDERQRLLYPAEVLCPGDNLWNGRLYCDYFNTCKQNYGPLMTSPAGGCCYDEAWGIGNFCDMSGGTATDPKGFLERIFRTAILMAWYNRRPVVAHSMTATDYRVERKGGVVANVRMSDRTLVVREGDRTVVEGGDYFLDMPHNGGTVLVYSKKGCDREFVLPKGFPACAALEGRLFPEERAARLEVAAGKVRVKLPAGHSLALRPARTGTAAEVRRVILPERLERGNTSVVPLSPVDSAAWIAPADRTVPKGGLFLKFRKEFDADGVTPLRFHLSADERFVLMLDGETVARGPDRGAPDMWFFQSYETVPAKGRHVFDAVVWKLNPGQIPNAQLTWNLGFVFAAEGAYDAALTTGKAKWKVARLVNTEMTKRKYPLAIGAQCVVRGRDFLAEEPDVRAWRDPVVVRPPIRANEAHSSRKTGWLVYPSQLPAQVARTSSPGSCVAVDGQAFVTNGIHFKVGPYDEWGSNAVFAAESAADPRRAGFDALLKEGRPLTIPAGTSVRYLWNLGEYHCAYPRLATKGGRGATLAWGWAEALYVGDCFDWHTVVIDKVRKGLGNRNEFAGKYFYGITDEFRPDGGAGSFTSPWWKCGLYCLIEVRTGDEPLTIERIAIDETRYPFDPEAYFHCDDESLEAVQRLCLRGLQMCMHEMHFDCPYYEQQMYGGDTRLQMMMTQALSPDDALNRQAFRLFEVSQRDNGMISMNYPTVWLQESTSFSQYWGMMLGDYAMWRDNPEWVRARMPSVRRMLFGLERHLDADGFQSGTPGWYFVDWVPDWPSGTAPGHDGNRSAIDNLLYLLTLRKAALVETSIGETELAARWTRRADALARGIAARFWCERRGLVADTPEMDRFSEHAQALAVLTGVLTPEREARVAEGLASADDLARCTASFSSYLFEAYFKLGRTDLFLKKLDTWREYVRMGLHTPLEGPGDARSDCHAWSSNPLYHLHTGVAGVNPAEPGFKSVRIAPQPGPLKWIRSKTSTPRGYVVQDLRFDGDRMEGSVVLPDGLAGKLIWRGEAYPLHEGKNAF